MHPASGISHPLHDTPPTPAQVCNTGNKIRQQQTADVAGRVNFEELDVTAPEWPVAPGSFDLVLISYVSGSVPAEAIPSIYAHAFKALKAGGRLLIHDFMVDDSLDGPALGALWALQHVTVNADGLGLCPANVTENLVGAGFTDCSSKDLISGMTKLVVGHKK